MNIRLFCWNNILSADNENGQTEYYNVQEYYRVRVGAEKIYLLNFERTMEEIFQGDGAHVPRIPLILASVPMWWITRRMKPEILSVLYSRESCGATISLRTK